MGIQNQNQKESIHFLPLILSQNPDAGQQPTQRSPDLLSSSGGTLSLFESLQHVLGLTLGLLTVGQA